MAGNIPEIRAFIYTDGPRSPEERDLDDMDMDDWLEAIASRIARDNGDQADMQEQIFNAAHVTTVRAKKSRGFSLWARKATNALLRLRSRFAAVKTPSPTGR